MLSSSLIQTLILSSPFGQGTILHLYPLSLIGNGEFHAVVAPLPLEIHRNAIGVDIRSDEGGADMPLAYFFQPDARQMPELATYQQRLGSLFQNCLPRGCDVS